MLHQSSRNDEGLSACLSVFLENQHPKFLVFFLGSKKKTSDVKEKICSLSPPSISLSLSHPLSLFLTPSLSPFLTLSLPFSPSLTFLPLSLSLSHPLSPFLSLIHQFQIFHNQCFFTYLETLRFSLRYRFEFSFHLQI